MGGSNGSMEAYMEAAYESKNAGRSSSALIGLPVELQDSVIDHLSLQSLRNLQQVSRHLHHRASRRIWRRLIFKLVPGAAVNIKSPQYRLVDVLKTIIASSHNYAQYIHEFDVTILEDGGNGNNEQQVAQRFLPDTDGQKLLSLSLLMLLRGATRIEKFRWIAPIELDASCWKQIANRQSLRRLAVSLHARNPIFVGRHAEAPVDLSYKHMSGCSGLHALYITNLDDLNHLEHIASCISSSSGSLNSLTLTFSAALAAKAKKSSGSTAIPPPPPVDLQNFDPEDLSSASEDDNQITPSSTGINQPSQDPELIKQHKAVQETALACLLSVHSEETRTTMRNVDLALQNASKVTAAKKTELDPRTVKSIHDLVDRLMKGKKIDDTKMLEQLRDKLDSATVSRSAKRQKPSSASKGKSKTPKASAVVQSYSNYALPKSSNTSTLSNPWAVASPAGFPASTAISNLPPLPPGPAMSAFSHVGYPASLQPPSLQPGGLLVGNSSNAMDLLEDQSLDIHNDDLLFSPANGTSGKLFNLIGALGQLGGQGSAGADSVYDWYLEGQIPSANADAEFDAAKEKFVKLWGECSNKDKAKKKKNNLKKKMLTKPLVSGGPPPMPAFPGSSKAFPNGSFKKTVVIPDDDEDLSDGSESASDEPTSASNSVPPSNHALDEHKSSSYDDMGVDMAHPDQNGAESGDDQEVVDDGDETPRSLKDKGKGKEVTPDLASVSRTSARSLSPAKRGRDAVEEDTKDTSPEQLMREWIRKEHGLALERLSLYLVPMKASVLGRALQLHRLKSLVLLSVGGQGPFWQLMCKVQDARLLSLKEIFTDDVSAPFLQCVSQLEGVTKLQLRRRSKKAGDNTTSKDPASIEEIRKLAVQPHLDTLEVLSIENSQDQSWCLTQAFTWLLCARGNQLRELAFQAGSHRMVEFISQTDVPCSRSSPQDRKFGLGKLNTLFYLGVGPSPALTGAHGAYGVAIGELHPNGEPADASHDLWARDHYKNGRESLIAWARRRRHYDDKKLKYVGVVNNVLEIGKPRVVTRVPSWLLDEFELVKAKASGNSTVDLDTWIKESKYDKWVTQKVTDVKAKRFQDCKAVLFQTTSRHAKLSS